MSWYLGTGDEKNFQEQRSTATYINGSRQCPKIASSKKTIFHSSSKFPSYNSPQKFKSNKYYKKSLTYKSNSGFDAKPHSNHNNKPNSNFKTNSSLWIRIDLFTITFYPNKKELSSICGQMELLLKYSRSVLAISFNKKKLIEEIQIPWSEIKSFRIVNGRDIEIVFCEGFQPKFCNHSKNFCNYHKNNGKYMNTEEIIRDPTGGFMNGATSILLSPCPRVHPATITMIDAAIQRFCFYNNGIYDNREEKVVDAISSNIIKEKEQSSLSNNIPPEVSEKDDNIMYVTIVFLTHRRVMLSPMNISVSAILQDIEKRFAVKIDSFKYRNINGDWITVMNEDDWRVAMWNTKKLENRMTVYLDN